MARATFDCVEDSNTTTQAYRPKLQPCSSNPMAAFGSSISSTGLAPHTTVILHPRRQNPVVSASSHHQRSLNGLAMNSSGMNNALSIRGTTRISAVDPGAPANPSPSGGNLPIPNIIPEWSRWMVGAVIFAVPMYRQFRATEEMMEQAAVAAIVVINNVAEAAEKLAVGVAEAFPGNENIRAAASKFKKVMDMIEEDADKAHAVLDKVDEIMDEMDSVVDKVAKGKSRTKKGDNSQ